MKSRLIPNENLSSSSNNTGERGVELLYAACSGTDCVIRKKKCLQTSNSIVKYSVGDIVLVAYGNATVTSTKRLAFRLRYYGPCRIVRAKHPEYVLRTRVGRYSRVAVHLRRLRGYKLRVKRAQRLIY